MNTIPTTTLIKKILLVTAITSAASASLASPLGTFYIKVGGGMNIMNKHQGKAQSYKAHLAGLAEIGVGYSILNNFRTDLTFTHYFSPEHTASTLKNDQPNKLIGHLKADINTYMINGYVDIIDMIAAKLFVGGGIGLAEVKQKYRFEITDSIKLPIKRTSGATKKANNLSYSVTTGITTSFTPIVDFELAYTWNDFGKTKSKNNGPTAHYKGHNLIGRLRFNI